MALVGFDFAAARASGRFVMDDMAGRDHVVALARAGGLAGYEPPYMSFIGALLGEAGGAFLDVGANTGLAALMAAAARPDITVFAFEPLAPVFDALLHNIGLNPALAPRVVPDRVALSDANGETVFHETINPHGLFSTSSGLNAAFSAQLGETRQHRVATQTLDAWVEQHGVRHISFIKVDVEGHEAAVLKGAARTASLLRPAIGVELLGGAEFGAVAAFLAAHDYVDCVLTPGHFSSGSAPAFVPEGWNHVLFPRERMELARDCASRIGLAQAR